MTDTQRKPRLYVFSGAGLSAESGVSTFRTKNGTGIWSRFDADDIGNFHRWESHRDEVFAFCNTSLTQIKAASPNAAHALLAQWQHTWGTERVLLITQNVDDLLERADALEVQHLHGDLENLLCTECDDTFPNPGGPLDPTEACPYCGELDPVKPAVVLFGEPAPMYARLREMREEMGPQDILVVVGTSFNVVTPSSLLPPSRYDAHARNFLIDPDPQRARFFGVVVAEPATTGLARIADTVTAIMNGEKVAPQVDGVEPTLPSSTAAHDANTFAPPVRRSATRAWITESLVLATWIIPTVTFWSAILKLAALGPWKSYSWLEALAAPAGVSIAVILTICGWLAFTQPAWLPKTST